MSSWRLVFKREAEKELEDLDNSISHRVVEKLDWLVVNFDAVKHLRLRENLVGYFKLRVGDWRVVYKFDETDHLVTIFAVRHRSRVYDT